MIIFLYSIKPAKISPRNKGYFLRVSDDTEDNVTACFDTKFYLHTLPKEEITKIIQITGNILIAKSVLAKESRPPQKRRRFLSPKGS